jgi:hypothetical protein
LSLFGGALAFVGLLALGRFFLALGGLDPASAFGGMGSSREMTIAAIAMGAAAIEVHHSLPGAPRMMPWDKDLQQLTRIGEFARTFQKLTKPGPMVKAPGEERKFIGRWQA